MRNQVFKKLFSVLLALIMVAGLLPASVLAEGEGNADSTPAPTEAVQPTESAEPTTPTETETPEVTEIPEPTPENPATTVEPTQGEPTAEPTEGITIAPVNEVAAQAETEINYVTKTNDVPLPDGTFYRIVHLDCGRKYFSEAQIKQIIDYAYNYGYTHVELAFGNDGLRFLLNDMEVSANGTTYTSEKVTSAIKAGNKAFYDAGTNELSQEEMDRIIAYAKGKGIGIIPMFDAPGHLQTVIRAMGTLGITVREDTEYSIPTTSGSSENWAINPTYAEGVNFVQALMQKYITYFAGKGCTMFNIAADECGFTSMSTETYTAYARLVNSMAAMVQNAGMTALAFNDGIYHKNLTTNVEFDTNIAVCYWDATTAKYASAATLAAKGFKIINTNNKWYYVIGKENITGSSWSQYAYTCEYAKQQMSSENSCLNIDGDSNTTTPKGCMLAMWCDYPGNNANWDNIKSYLSTMQTYNKDYFKQVEAPKTPAVTVSDENKTVKEVTKTADNTYKVVLKKATEGTAESQTLQLNVANGAEGATYTWTSNNEEVATVENDGLVTFKGAAGTVTITATPVAATRSISETAAYSITFNVTKEGEIAPVKRNITLYIGQEYADTINGYKYDPATLKNTDSSKAIATAENVHVDAETVKYSANATTSNYTGHYGNYYVENVIDRKADTKYYSNGIQTVGQYVQVELTNAIHFDAVRITTPEDMSGYNDDYCENAAVEISNDGNTWENLGSYTGSGNTKIAVFNNENLDRVKFIRVRITEAKNNWWQLAEIEWGNTDDSGNFTSMPASGTVTTEESDNTTVTIKGVAEGDTTVTIGHVTYNVHVTKENLTNVSPLPVQTWITNNVVESSESTTGNSYWAATWSRGTNNGNAYFVNLKPEDVYGKEGKSITECMPNDLNLFEFGGTYWKKAKDNKASKNLYVWRGLVHNTNSIQKIYGADYSNIGTEFNYIRYYGGKWEVSIDRTENSWIQVYGYNSISGNNVEQIAVYYMMRTEITTEVKTDVADWGYTKTDDKYSEQIGKKSYVILDFAVKIDGAELKPNNFPQDGKTFVFHCDENKGGVITSGNTRYRQLNNFRAVETLQEGYEVYMVTVTMTSGDSSNTISDTTSYSYDATTEQIIWAIDEETKVNSRLDEYTAITSGDTTYSGCKVGGDPYIRGIEVYNQHGALITYYIRYKAEEGKLTVRYFDATSGIENAKEFHNYSIGVKNIETDRFNQYIRLNDPDWKGDLLDGSVENKNGDTVKVSADLSTMSSIDPQYRYAKDYTCIQVDWKDEGKEVWLYYTFSSNVTYVVDFGIPLVIKPTDMSEELVNAKITSVTVDANTSYADITVNETDYSITYKLNKMINSADAIVVSYTGINKDNGNLGKVSYTVTIIPATNVYYEDSFAKFTNGSYNGGAIAWEDAGTKPQETPTQALEALGNKTNVYGYDPAYQNSTMFSMGSARKVNVTNDMAKDGVVWPTAQFTFKGTGFDIISLTDNTSGAIFVDVVNKETGKKEKSVFVDNYYGYTYNSETNTWDATPEKANALYQIPVIALRNLPYAEYNVVIKVAYSEYFDHTAKPQGSYSFWLDAVRVYDPMGVDNDIYNTGNEKEGYPQYIKLRDELAKTENTTVEVKSMVFIDGGNTADIATYANIGPNNEVYLANGQAIMFKLNVGNANIETIQIGAKAPMSEGTAKLNVNNTDVVENGLSTATEMYYKISQYGNNTFTITNTGKNILSLTNLKITFTSKPDTEVTLAKLSEAEQQDAVATVRALFAPAPVEPEPEPEPEKTFEPERFEASWSRNVMEGRKATLTVKTSEDVEAITVDGQTIRSYRTRTERVGFGRRAKRITYREFTYSMVAQESADFSVTAINAEGTESEAITARLTVKTRPNSMRDMWDWFKGWF